MPLTPSRPSWRKPAGIALILLLILVWAAIVVSLFELIRTLPWPAHLLYFLAAGILWVLPLKPLLRWMESGRRRG